MINNKKKVKQVLAQGVKLASLSKYAQFSMLCIGYVFFYKGSNQIIDKWELYELGYTNPNKLFSGDYGINAVERQ